MGIQNQNQNQKGKLDSAEFTAVLFSQVNNVLIKYNRM